MEGNQPRLHLAGLEALRRRRAMAGELSRAGGREQATAVRSVSRRPSGSAAVGRAGSQPAVRRVPEMEPGARAEVMPARIAISQEHAALSPSRRSMQPELAVDGAHLGGAD